MNNITIPTPSCASTTYDVWHTFLVPKSRKVDFETIVLLVTDLAIYSRDVTNGINEIICKDEGSITRGTWDAGLSITGRTENEILYVRLWIWSAGRNEFTISAWDPDGTLSNESFKLENPEFKYYVYRNETLIMESEKQIDNLAIYSMQGGKMTASSNSSNTEIDISNLSPGVYIINVLIDGNYGTFKILK